MEQLVRSSRRMPEEEYLRMEESSAIKHEYRNGEIVAMAGGILQHAELAANLLRKIGNRLDGKPCKVVGSDLRVRIAQKGTYCYPDVTVFCGQPVYDPPDRRTTIANPQVVIEVTSASTEGVDRGEKFYDYMRIESLLDYILVSQDRVWVNTFYLGTDGIWAIGPSADRLDQSVTLRSLGISLPLSEIYSGVKLQPATPLTEPV